MINTESNKRMKYVDENDFTFDYCLDTNTSTERHCMKDKNGYIVHFFNSKEEADGQIPLLKRFASEIMNGLNEKTRQHKRHFPQYYIQTYEEANFTHKALYKGFKPYPEYFDPYDNWFGVSACAYPGYTPDAVLTRGNKSIKLSLQGMSMRVPNEKEKPSGWDTLSKECAIKYLAFTEDENILYETFSGQLPTNEFIENFLSIPK